MRGSTTIKLLVTSLVQIYDVLGERLSWMHCGRSGGAIDSPSSCSLRVFSGFAACSVTRTDRQLNPRLFFSANKSTVQSYTTTLKGPCVRVQLCFGFGKILSQFEKLTILYITQDPTSILGSPYGIFPHPISSSAPSCWETAHPPATCKPPAGCPGIPCACGSRRSGLPCVRRG